MANWIITYGRFDIAYACKKLSPFLIVPRKGHLDAMYCIFEYLKKFPGGKVVTDPHPLSFLDLKFEEYDWTKFYPDTSEELTPNMPEPKDKPANIT